MRLDLWPQGSEAEQGAEIAAFFQGTEKLVVAVFVCEHAPEAICGFLELSVRNYAEGCSGPTPYVEGWFVEADVRRQGVGGALMRVAEAWAVEHGYRELASDAELDNDQSLRAHESLGFEEVVRAVHYRKALPSRA